MSLRCEIKLGKAILHNGIPMPLVGFGTYKITGKETVYRAIDAALKANYQSIDSAAGYRNESHIGSCLQELLLKYNLSRKDIFLTSKLKTMQQRELTVQEVEAIKNRLNESLECYGMESYSFKVDWYNCKVHDAFKFPYNKDTIAFTIISTPSMFEKAFIPYLDSVDLNNVRDPLDQCMRNCLSKVSTQLSDFDIELIHDFELTPTRRPKVLMQTAGHVCGAAKFYQRTDLGAEDPWDKKKKIFGVSLHPKYGGWFAFRAVIILKNATCKELLQREPEAKIKEKADIINLLNQFNDNWKDAKYRDAIPVEERYSALQRKYFDTLPAERHQLIRELQSQSNGHT